MSALSPAPEGALGSALLLGLLALTSLLVALVPRWRRKFHWGRTRDSYPVTQRGCAGIVAAFAVMAGGPAGVHAGLLSGGGGFSLLLAGFLVFVLAGFFDRPRGGTG